MRRSALWMVPVQALQLTSIMLLHCSSSLPLLGMPQKPVHSRFGSRNADTAEEAGRYPFAYREVKKRKKIKVKKGQKRLNAIREAGRHVPLHGRRPTRERPLATSRYGRRSFVLFVFFCSSNHTDRCRRCSGVLQLLIRSSCLRSYRWTQNGQC